MKYLLLVLCFCLMSCISPKKDLMPSPSSLEQHRLPIKVNGVVEIGIAGVIQNSKIEVKSFPKSGTISIRGLRECGYYDEFSYQGSKWNVLELPEQNSEVCQYLITSRSNDLDATITGVIIVRKYYDPNVAPLKLTLNKRLFSGVGFVQLKSEQTASRENLFLELTDNKSSGIYESRELELYPTGKLGYINISGCGINTESYYFEEINTWKTTLDSIYKQLSGIKQSCVFDILVNNSDYIKESATLFVNVYRESGSFLTRPLVEHQDNKTCFTFEDPFVIGVCVNNQCTKQWNDNSKCVSNQNTYEVEALTSKGRLFYGVNDNQTWSIK